MRSTLVGAVLVAAAAAGCSAPADDPAPPSPDASEPSAQPPAEPLAWGEAAEVTGANGTPVELAPVAVRYVDSGEIRGSLSVVARLGIPPTSVTLCSWGCLVLRGCETPLLRPGPGTPCRAFACPTRPQVTDPHHPQARKTAPTYPGSATNQEGGALCLPMVPPRLGAAQKSAPTSRPRRSARDAPASARTVVCSTSTVRPAISASWIQAALGWSRQYRHGATRTKGRCSRTNTPRP